VLALELALSLLDRKDFAAKNTILVGRERLGKVYEALDDVTSAETTYNELLREYELISEAQPDNSKWKENLMAIHWRVGWIDEKNCRLDKALGNYKRALELSRKLRRAEPDRVDWSHELSLSLKHIAHAYELTGDIEDARAHYRESLEINQALVEKQPGKEDLKADRREIEAALANLGGMRPNCPLQPQP
jgi:tetratricopeptide (TPR) repeat protein